MVENHGMWHLSIFENVHVIKTKLKLTDLTNYMYLICIYIKQAYINSCYSSAYYLISQVIWIKYRILTSASLGGTAAASPSGRPGWEDKWTLVLECHLVDDRDYVGFLLGLIQYLDRIHSEQISRSIYLNIFLSYQSDRLMLLKLCKDWLISLKHKHLCHIYTFLSAC